MGCAGYMDGGAFQMGDALRDQRLSLPVVLALMNVGDGAVDFLAHLLFVTHPKFGDGVIDGGERLLAGPCLVVGRIFEVFLRRVQHRQRVVGLLRRLKQFDRCTHVRLVGHHRNHGQEHGQNRAQDEAESEGTRCHGEQRVECC